MSDENLATHWDGSFAALKSSTIISCWLSSLATLSRKKGLVRAVFTPARPMRSICTAPRGGGGGLLSSELHPVSTTAAQSRITTIGMIRGMDASFSYGLFVLPQKLRIGPFLVTIVLSMAITMARTLNLSKLFT